MGLVIDPINSLKLQACSLGLRSRPANINGIYGHTQHTVTLRSVSRTITVYIKIFGCRGHHDARTHSNHTCIIQAVAWSSRPIGPAAVNSFFVVFSFSLSYHVGRRGTTAGRQLYTPVLTHTRSTWPLLSASIKY